LHEPQLLPHAPPIHVTHNHPKLAVLRRESRIKRGDVVAGRVPHHSHFLLNLLEDGAIPAVQVDDLDEQGLGFRVKGAIPAVQVDDLDEQGLGFRV
jgi:hypothetical protein